MLRSPPGISPMEAHAPLGILAAGSAHVQQFRALLHDMPATFTAAAAAGYLVLTNPTVYWDQVSQRVQITIRYRVVEGKEASLATPGALIHIQILLAQMAKHLGLWPHDTMMVPDCLGHRCCRSLLSAVSSSLKRRCVHAAGF